MNCIDCKHALCVSADKVRCGIGKKPGIVSTAYCLRLCDSREPGTPGVAPECPQCGSRFHAECPVPADHSTEAESKRRSCCDPVKP